jgi:molybdopterin molybdotransferase
MTRRTREPANLDRVSFERARSLVVSPAEPLPAEMVELGAALGRIAALTIFADDDLVPYARSAMDGFALRSADTPGAAAEHPVALALGGTTYAGDAPGRLLPGEVLAIATGAPLPAGADAVVPIEDVSRHGDTIVLRAPLSMGEHVFGAGDDARRGDVLVRHGDEITPGRTALLAAAGHAAIRVHRRPRVAVVCTGDEVVAVTATPGRGQIRNSNAAMLGAHLARDGAEITFVAQAADSPEALRAVLRAALALGDLVITTGGASVGERDLVKGAFAALGARFAFRSVAMRPSKPAAFGMCGKTLVAVLPGNPAAAFVGYVSLVRGVVRRLAGRVQAFPDAVAARLEGSVHAKPERHFLMFGRLTHAGGAFSVTPLGNQCSSLVRTSADANALIVVPPGSARLESGAAVMVEVFDWNLVPFA